MPIIRDRAIVADDWIHIGAGDNSPPLPATGKLLVPLKVWKESREYLILRGEPLGVWLAGVDDPADLAEDIGRLALVAVNFPRFADGRGYSAAFLLRERYGYRGELRAIGDVLRDQMFYLQRVGFNAFAVRADRDINDALAAPDEFSETYQASADQRLPLFRRRAAKVTT